MTTLTQNTSTPINNKTVQHPKGLREVQSLSWLGIGFYLLLALLTYSSLDPGWSRVSSDTIAVSNSAGIAGAWLADLFFSFLGKAAFLLPLFCGLQVLAIWRPQRMAFGFFLRWLAQCLLVIASAGLFALHSIEPDANIINAAGGIIGLEVGQSLMDSFGLFGASMLLLAVVVMNGTLVSSLSWNFILEALGYLPYAGLLKMQANYRRKTREYKEHQQQQLDLQAAAQKAEAAFKLNITNTQVNAQIQPVSDNRIEPSLPIGDIPALGHHNQSISNMLGTETPQLMAELNQVIAGFSATETPDAQAKNTTTPSIDSQAAEAADAAEKQRLQESQDQLAAEFGAFLGDEEHTAIVEKVIDKTADEWMPEADAFPVLKTEPEPVAVPVKPLAVEEPEHFLDEAAEKWLAEDHVHAAEVSGKADGVVIETAVEQVQELAVEHKILAEAVQETPAVIEPIAPVVSMAKDSIATDLPSEPLPEEPVLSVEYGLPDDDEDDFAAEAEIEKALQQEPAPVAQPQPAVVQIKQAAAYTQAPRPVAQLTPANDLENEAEEEEEEEAPVVLPSFSKPAPTAVARPVSKLPSLDLLERPDANRKAGFTPEQLERLSRLLEIKLREFNIEAKVVDAYPGPVITRFEVDPAPGVKVSKISNIAKDLARSMAMVAVRVVEVIPGKTVIGIEVPNENRQIVRFMEILAAPIYQEKESPVTMALGKDISGKAEVADLARMPHLLVAGTTGSGKSVGVNAMILSILYKATPDDVRLILIDPKMLELSIYDKIPHLLTPVVTDMKDAANALRWCVAEMERRYKLMAAVGVRNLAGFNAKLKEAEARGENILDPLWKKEDSGLMDSPPRLDKMPFIVVVIDEFADMMMIVGKKVEELIARIAQKARAAGIHLILATQRPSVDVITGLIKANVPSRIAFQVSSKIDSRTILDQGGAEQLLGHGDMLFQPVGTNIPSRIHGAFVSDDEVHRVCDHWRSMGEPNYVDEILEEYTDDGVPAKGVAGGMGDEEADAEQDVLYDDAVAFVLETRRASISFVQRKFKIGYNRAARLIEAMEMAGLVSSMQSNGQREVLIPNND